MLHSVFSFDPFVALVTLPHPLWFTQRKPFFLVQAKLVYMRSIHVVPERHAAYGFHSSIARYRWTDDACSIVRSSRTGCFNVYIPSFICGVGKLSLAKDVTRKNWIKTRESPQSIFHFNDWALRRSVILRI